MQRQGKKKSYLQQRAVGLLKGLVHQRNKDGLDDTGHGGASGEVHVVLGHLRIGHAGRLKQIQHAAQIAVRQLQNRVATTFRGVHADKWKREVSV